jgi:capsular polysaccharide biosynthesis protein
LFQKAKIVVGLYGAGLLNVIFSNKKTKVLEIRNSKSDNLYKYITQNAGINYKSIIFKGRKKNNTIRDFDADIYINKKKFTKVLNEIL